jgi:hypothetical protein
LLLPDEGVDSVALGLISTQFAGYACANTVTDKPACSGTPKTSRDHVANGRTRRSAEVVRKAGYSTTEAFGCLALHGHLADNLNLPCEGLYF